MKILRLGTRQSLLAKTQSGHVAEQLMKLFPDIKVELVLITTSGDLQSSSRQSVSRDPSTTVMMDPPLTAGGDDVKGGLKALFTKELEEALLSDRIDFAVHSLKDMSADLPEGLVLGAVPERENPFDAWISRDGTPFANLKKGARVGTGAARRVAQLRLARPDLEIVPLRGNVDTRLRKLKEDNLDGIILAVSGLKRLGRAAEITEILSGDLLLPAVGQGALAIEVRRNNTDIAPFLKAIDHIPSHQAALAERAFLQALGGSCQTPIAAHATLDGQQVNMKGLVLSPDGKQVLRAAETGRSFDSAGVGSRLAAQLLAAGAGKLLGR